MSENDLEKSSDTDDSVFEEWSIGGSNGEDSSAEEANIEELNIEEFKIEEQSPDEPKKKRRKGRLLLQVALVITLSFAVLIVIADIAVIFGGKKSTMDTAEELLQKDIRDMQAGNAFLAEHGWLVDYFYEHGAGLMDSVTDEDMEQSDFLFDDEMLLIADTFPREQLETFTPLQQKLYAYHMFYKVYGDFMVSAEYLFIQQKTVFIMDIRDGREGFLYQYADPSYTDPEKRYQFTELGMIRKDLAPSEDTRKKLRSAASDEMQFYEEKETEDGKYYMIGYAPLKVDGENRLILGIGVDWTRQKSLQDSTLYQVLNSLFAGFVLVAGVLLIFLHRAAVDPAVKIQKGVRDYAKNKDSRAVVDQMKTIRKRNELGVLADDIADMVTEIDRYTAENAALSEARNRVETELSLATHFQRELLPKGTMQTDRFRLAASMDPAREVGGDFYDFFLLDEDHLVFLIADVSDKGMSAAFFMAITKTMIKSRARMGGKASEIIPYVNEMLEENNPEGHFVTSWIAIIDLRTGEVNSCNAGHDYPAFCMSEAGYVIEKMPHGTPIAFGLGAAPVDYDFTMPHGGRILLYTDGITDAMRADGERFGAERLQQVLNDNRDLEDEELLAAITRAIREFAGDAPQFDDMTMLSFTYLKSEAATQKEESEEET